MGYCQRLNWFKKLGCFVFPLLLLSFFLQHSANACKDNTNLLEKTPRDTLVFGVATDMPPFEFSNIVDSPCGFNHHLFKHIAKSLSVEVAVVRASAVELRQMFEAKQIDAISDLHLSGLPLEESLKTKAYATIDHAIFTRQESGIGAYGDLYGKRILVQTNSIMHDYAHAYQLSDQIIVLDDISEIFSRLAAGEGDCVLAARPQGLYLIDTLHLNEIRQLPPPIQATKLHIRVHQHWGQLLSEMNLAISEYHEGGKYERQRKKWLSNPGLFPRSNYAIRLVLITCLVLGFLLALVCVWVLTLHRTVRYRTQRLERALLNHQATEKALCKSEERYRLLVENQTDLILKVNRENEIEFSSPSVAHYFTVKPSHFMGNRVSKYLHKQDYQALEEVHEQVQQAPYEAHFEHRVKSPKGWRTLSWAVRGVPDDQQGVESAVCVGRDITELRQAQEERLTLEKQILQTQKLESLGILAGGIAHDFNNMLTTILGHAELSLQKVGGESVHSANITEIKIAAQRAAELCRQMLAYAGKGDLSIAPIDLNRLVEEMSHLMEVSISKRIRYQCNLAPKVPLMEGDASQIRQVVMNFITNASDALEGHNGAISINTRMQRFRKPHMVTLPLQEELEAGTYVLLEVTDTGEGMNEETLNRIFDPFYTTKIKGRGLGLAAVLGVVRRHQGAIEVLSAPGEGTTMRVYFPAIAVPKENGEAFRPLDNSWRGQGKLLLVDDDAHVLEIAAMILEQMGFSLITAENGANALIALEKHPDVVAILLDFTMPGMSGEEAYGALRSINEDVPIVICSGYSKKEVEQRFSASGVADFLQKPYQISTMQRCLQKILHQVSA